jgi:glycosyltransferase 2 family protein
MRMFAKIKKIIRQGHYWRVFLTILSLCLLVYLVTIQGWDVFFQTLRQIPPVYFLLALFLVLLSRLSVTLRWYVLLRYAGMKIRFWQCLRLVFMGLFASNFLPSTVGGDLARMAGALSLRIDSGVTAASLLIDRLIGMAGMALFLPAGLAAGVAQGFGTIWQAPLMPMCTFSISMPWLLKIRERMLGFVGKIMSSAVYWWKHPASLGIAFLFTLAHMLFTFLTIALLLSGMRQPLSLLVIGGLWSFSYFISLAPFSINGLGLQEVSIAYLYSHFGGVSMETGLALAVLLRMLFLIASLPGAVFLPDILRPSSASPLTSQRPEL